MLFPGDMSSGNGTIDYDAEAHTLDAHKTSAARQESTTKNLQVSDNKVYVSGTTFMYPSIYFTM